DMPPAVGHLVAVGVESGRLAGMLDRVGRLLEEEADARLETAMILLEPALIGLCGLAVGFVVMAAFLPAYRLALEAL
ncbi:MAG: type II secretion system F family protein, partial [Candidatus Eremiobacterota bacterium]